MNITTLSPNKLYDSISFVKFINKMIIYAISINSKCILLLINSKMLIIDISSRS